MDAAQKKVLILGGGFAGVRVALNLEKQKNREVSLVDIKNYHTYHADLYKLVNTPVKLQSRLEFEELEGTVNIPYWLIFRQKRVNFIQGWVESIDLKNSLVKVGEKIVNFDYLVIAFGSSTCFYGIKGAKEFSHPFKTTEDALNVRNDLVEEIVLKGDYKVVIAGGGFTGVELTGSIIELFQKLKAVATHINPQLTLIEAAPNLLTGMPAWAQELALKKLIKIGVEVKLESKIDHVEKGMVVFEGGTHTPYDYLIWTTGVEGESSKNLGLEINKKQQLITNPDLSVVAYKNVFALGDVAATNSPPAAWAALAQAECVSTNIINIEKGRPTLVYLPPQPAFVVPIGSHFGLTNAWGLKVSGLIPIFLKDLITLKYLLSILTIIDAVKFWLKGVKILELND